MHIIIKIIFKWNFKIIYLNICTDKQVSSWWDNWQFHYISGILVTASKSKDNTYNYNTVTAVLMTECVKLIAAAAIFLKE